MSDERFLRFATLVLAVESEVLLALVLEMFRSIFWLVLLIFRSLCQTLKVTLEEIMPSRKVLLRIIGLGDLLAIQVGIPGCITARVNMNMVSEQILAAVLFSIPESKSLGDITQRIFIAFHMLLEHLVHVSLLAFLQLFEAVQLVAKAVAFVRVPLPVLMLLDFRQG